MIPVAHAGVGYLLYSLWTRLSRRGPPADVPTVFLLFGTQLPDLVDKPLYVLFGMYHGRAIMHSVFVVVPLCLLVFSVTDRYDGQHAGIAFSVGALTHLLGDALISIYRGKTGELGFLAWPITSPPVYDAPNPLDHLWWLLRDLRGIPGQSPAQLLGDLLFLELLLSFCIFLLWLSDGQPCVRPVWRWTVKRIGL